MDINLNLFIDKARKGNVKNSKTIAIAFRKSGAMIACAVNRIVGDKGCRTIHAEDALVRKLWKLSAIERFGYINVLVLRWSPGRLRSVMAKPCDACMRKLKKYGISQIAFSNDAGITTIMRSGITFKE